MLQFFAHNQVKILESRNTPLLRVQFPSVVPRPQKPQLGNLHAQ